MTGSSGMHGGGGGVTSAALNGIKLEAHNGGGNSGSAGGVGSEVGVAGNGGSGYYCNSYTPPAPVDHGLLSSAYSESILPSS